MTEQAKWTFKHRQTGEVVTTPESRLDDFDKRKWKTINVTRVLATPLATLQVYTDRQTLRPINNDADLAGVKISCSGHLVQTPRMDFYRATMA